MRRMEESEIGEVSVDKSAEAAHEKAQEEHRRAPWLRWLALSTAAFAVVAAIASLLSGRHANEALLHQTRATDQWAYYQAKGNKAVTRKAEAEILAELHAPADRVAAVRADVGKYSQEQEEISKKAQELEAESHGDLHRHEWYAGIVTLLQVAIGLSAIAALLENQKIWLGSLAAGGAALVTFVVRLFVG
jgi:hypothetical protein